jgi:hypothetical protein
MGQPYKPKLSNFLGYLELLRLCFSYSIAEVSKFETILLVGRIWRFQMEQYRIIGRTR